jgi:hypothetical protein
VPMLGVAFGHLVYVPGHDAALGALEPDVFDFLRGRCAASLIHASSCRGRCMTVVVL